MTMNNMGFDDKYHQLISSVILNIYGYQCVILKDILDITRYERNCYPMPRYSPSSCRVAVLMSTRLSATHWPAETGIVHIYMNNQVMEMW